MMQSLALVRLLQLSSPALPIGAYSYSQGLEWVVDAGTIRSEADAQQWIGDLLEWNLGRFEAPWLADMLAAWQAEDAEQLQSLDGEFIASRETAELRAETVQMGYSLLRLLEDLADFPEAPRVLLRTIQQPSFPLVWSAAAAAWQVPIEEALAAYLWAWAENQVMAALKAVPLGQTSGQRILLALGERIPKIAQRAMPLGEDEISNFAPAFAIASCRHETQYSRLFRS
jgi:urease accessory protein